MTLTPADFVWALESLARLHRVPAAEVNAGPVKLG